MNASPINRPAFNPATVNRTNVTNVNRYTTNNVVNNTGYNRAAYPYRSNFVNGTWPGHYGGWNRNGYGGQGFGGLGYGGYGGNGYGGYGGYGGNGYGGYGGYGGGGLGLLTGLGLGSLGGLGLAGLGGGGWGYGGYGNGYGGYGNGYGGYGNNYGGYGGGYGNGLGLSSYTGWGFNPYSYGWGYSNYTNPFYGAGGLGLVNQGLPITTTAYNYSLPIDVAATPPAETILAPAMDDFENARAAFKANDYSQALTLIDQTIKVTPNDANAHEFRGITLFALGQYKDASTALYPVLSASPGWDWTTLIGIYPDVDTYTNQLRALEAFRNQNPSDPSARFVLAYLYTGQGSAEAAGREYGELAKLLPNDQLVKRMARVITEEPTNANAASNAPATPVNPNTPLDTPPADPTPAATSAPASTVPPAQIDGTWKASPNTDTAITLTHNPDGTFVWDVVNKGQSKPIKGKSIYKNDILALAQTDGPPLAGKITWSGTDKFNFRLVGNGPEDPGLNFTK